MYNDANNKGFVTKNPKDRTFFLNCKEIDIDFSNIYLWFAGGFTVYIVFLTYLHFGFYRLLRQQKSSSFPFISILVSARNESTTIQSCANALLAQTYPHHLLEIIIVDDFSTDETIERLQGYSNVSNLVVFRNPIQKKYKSSKKTALEQAIHMAKGDILLFTDADCLPPPQWAATMVSFFDAQTALVAGFSPQTAERSIWNHVQICDSLSAAVVAAGSIGFGHGITCTGRNLAYRKQVFERIGGFADLPNSLSGDDDFILQKMAKLPDWQVRYAVDPLAVVPSKGPAYLLEFLKQKRRHISAGRHFSLRQQLGYALFHLTNVVLWLAPIIDLFCGTRLWIFLTTKILFDILLLKRFAAKFQIKQPLYSMLLWELLFAAYNILAVFSAFKTSQTWN